jgi:hypothetical protein
MNRARANCPGSLTLAQNMGRAGECCRSRRQWSSLLPSSTTTLISLLCWSIWKDVRPIEAFRAGGPMPLAISSRRGFSSSVAIRPPARLQRSGYVNGSYLLGSAADAESVAGSSSSSSSSSSHYSYEAILDFAQPATIDLVDRLDDAIMGGVSTSSVQPSKDGYAIWAGVCRTDGGYVPACLWICRRLGSAPPLLRSALLT